ncbi:MAG TPA: hypothetical protein VN577_22590 [Terriglobales bacterium]|nr:hypothetical protein [Terriglobales bacterium]
MATALILILTITLGMTFGVVSGYLIITGVLGVFARKPKTEKASLAPATQGIAGD